MAVQCISASSPEDCIWHKNGIPHHIISTQGTYSLINKWGDLAWLWDLSMVGVQVSLIPRTKTAQLFNKFCHFCCSVFTSIKWVRKIPWRGKWQPTPVLLAGESHGQRSLVSYSPWGHRIRHDWATSLSLSLLRGFCGIMQVKCLSRPW